MSYGIESRAWNSGGGGSSGAIRLGNSPRDSQLRDAQLDDRFALGEITRAIASAIPRIAARAPLAAPRKNRGAPLDSLSSSPRARVNRLSPRNEIGARGGGIREYPDILPCFATTT